jgi:hypothetical protein
VSTKIILSMRVAMFTLLIAGTFITTSGQTPLTVSTPEPKVQNVAKGNDLYCAGFIQSSPIATGNKLIAGQDEADQFTFAQNDLMYINMGTDKDVRVGDVFSVVRPRGAVKSKWSKKGDLGFFVQEVGSVEVLKVKQNVSAVRVKWSCDNFLLGDLVQLREQKSSPVVPVARSLDLFGDPSGKATGRIVMSRDGAEALAKNFIAYVDLGVDDQVKVGDTLTIFRELEKGNLTRLSDRDTTSARDYGFGSDTYSGGNFSNKAPAKSGSKAGGQEVYVSDVRSSRPAKMRKVVGEAVVINVKEKAATVIITRTSQEVHTGDWVEVR